MWRWSYREELDFATILVFSTYVEVIPCLLRSCDFFCKCSPRMWRWSLYILRSLTYFLVFSTYVEVILCLVKWNHTSNCVLHVCGGDPLRSDLLTVHQLCSPRMWSWSCFFWHSSRFRQVFSTYVEVILSGRVWTAIMVCVLHVCGGDPCWATSVGEILTVFSTYVEVILQHGIIDIKEDSVLHVCRDDSKDDFAVMRNAVVFSTYVELILKY